MTWPLARIALNLYLIIKSDRSALGRLPLLKTYCRLALRYILVESLLKKTISLEQVFGWRVRLQNYGAFLYLFEEIFVRNIYGFHSSKKVPVILDGGSNVGVSIFFFKKMHPAARVIAFEPNPAAFSFLKVNCLTNGFSDVELHNTALYDQRGRITLYCDPIDSTSLIASTDKDRTAGSSTTVEAALLSDYIHSDVDFLKLDVEGDETRVIRDVQNTNKLGYINEMAIEYHHHVRKNDDKFSEILSILENAGFGYQLGTVMSPGRGSFQDILIRAYRKNP